MSRVPMSHRVLTFESPGLEFSGDVAINLSGDTVFEFLDDEDGQGSSVGSTCDNIFDQNEAEDEDGHKDNVGDTDFYFWEAQRQLLQTTICRTTSLETKIRSITRETLKEAKKSGSACGCPNAPLEGGCRSCLMKAVCSSLQSAGFDSAICKSKWQSSDIPSGEHTFLEVVDSSNPKRGEVRVVIELSLRSEFEMAKAGEEYNKLVNGLPEMFVGKIERLLAVIKILCAAAKKCMKERKMHIAPWRKYRYMQAKWIKNCRRTTPALVFPVGESSGRPRRPRASMLTVDLLDGLPNPHRTAVAVV
ncbi:unnamed protein product [Cuscuta campestris]|uniref:Uncharacterized protein n=1 Tax=Cuscuta campestris TaxID=132261 RepID=A0A484MJS4_9ASTE|nr:unnamed protein product [Cuscuta campestris]